MRKLLLIPLLLFLPAKSSENKTYLKCTGKLEKWVSFSDKPNSFKNRVIFPVVSHELDIVLDEQNHKAKFTESSLNIPAKWKYASFNADKIVMWNEVGSSKDGLVNLNRVTGKYIFISSIFSRTNEHRTGEGYCMDLKNRKF